MAEPTDEFVDPGEVLAGPVDAHALPDLRAIFRDEPPEAVLWWVIRRFRPTFRFAGRPEDLAVIDMVADIDRRTPVIVEGSGRDEAMTRLLAERYDVEVRPTGSARLPAADRDHFPGASDRRESAGIQAWIESGLEGERIELEAGRLTCRPLAGWTRVEVETYLETHGLPLDPGG